MHGRAMKKPAILNRRISVNEHEYSEDELSLPSVRMKPAIESVVKGQCLRKSERIRDSLKAVDMITPKWRRTKRKFEGNE